MRFKICLFITLCFFNKAEAIQFTPSEERLISICDSYNLDYKEYRYHFDDTYFAKQNYNDFLLLSIPKSGTYLLDKLLTLIIGRISVFGIRTPEYLEKHPEEFMSDHDIPFSFKIFNRKIITTYRDFRDSLISYIYYQQWVNDKKWKMSKQELQNCLTEILKCLKEGTSPKNPNINIDFIKGTINVATYWKYQFKEKENKSNDLSYIFFVKFEDIIGEKGKGTYAKQFQTIQELTKNLDISLSKNQIEYLCKVLHGKSLTFRKGSKGDWRDIFTDEHKKLFKELFNSLLVDFGYEKDDAW